jgi:hypothetical protein
VPSFDLQHFGVAVVVVIEDTGCVCVCVFEVVGGGEGKRSLYVLGGFWVLGVIFDPCR